MTPSTSPTGSRPRRRLGLDAATVFKTLVADVDGKLTVAIVPVEHQLDLKALARAVGAKKAQMADVKLRRADHGLRRGRHLARSVSARRSPPCSTRAPSNTTTIHVSRRAPRPRGRALARTTCSA